MKDHTDYNKIMSGTSTTTQANVSNNSIVTETIRTVTETTISRLNETYDYIAKIKSNNPDFFTGKHSKVTGTVKANFRGIRPSEGGVFGNGGIFTPGSETITTPMSLELTSLGQDAGLFGVLTPTVTFRAEGFLGVRIEQVVAEVTIKVPKNIIFRAE